MKEVTSLEDILFNVVRPNKKGYAKDLANSYYVIDIVQPAQLNKSDTLIVIKKKLIRYGFDVKNLKHDQASDFITYINQDYLKNYGYVISDKIYQEEKAKLESKGIDFYSKYLNCNNDQQLYNLESIKQIN